MSKFELFVSLAQVPEGDPRLAAVSAGLAGELLSSAGGSYGRVLT